MEQDDKSAAMSDKDRKMASRFESAESKDDDEEKEEKESKKTTKIPKKSLFFGEDKPEKEDAKSEEKPETEKKNFLTELFTKDKIEDSPASEENSDVEEVAESTEDKTSEVLEQAPVEFSGEVSLRDDFEEVVVDRLQEVGQELELPDAQENLNEIQADAEFLEEVSERLEEGMEPEEAIDTALEDVLEQETLAEVELPQVESFDESSLVEEDDQLTARTNSQQSTTTTPPPVVPPVRPSTPPVQPVAPPPPLIPPVSPNTNTYYYNPNIIPPTQTTPNVAPSPNVATPEETEYGRRRSGDLLLGGMVGYMIGRRGGRKRTEARLEPEIKKRDAELEALRYKLEESEVAVRVDAAVKAPETDMVEKPVEVPSEPIEITKIEERVEHIPAETIHEEKKTIEKQEQAFEKVLAEATQIEPQAEVVEVPRVETQTEIVEVPVAQESASNHSPEMSAEEIVEIEKSESKEKFEKVSTSEQFTEKNENKQEKKKETPESVREKVEAKRDPRSMTMPELLDVADHIMYEKTSLRQLYERHRIDAVNLRRVVIEYFNGGTRYERLLLHSLEAVEMQRELRGEIKDDPGYKTNPVSSDDGQQTLPPVMENAGMAEAQSRQVNADSPSTQSSSMPVKEDRTALTNTTAVVVGILAGIIVMVIILITSNSL